MKTTTCRKNHGFTLVEIMIVVAIIGLLAAIAVPSFMRARMRSQATQVMNDYRMIDAAKDQYALEYNKPGTAAIGWNDITPYLKARSRLATTARDSLGNPISWEGGGPSTVDMRMSVNTLTKTTLSSVVDDTFWGPYS